MTDLLTMTGWGQRSTSYRFDLLDRELNSKGQLEVINNGISIDNNINRTIKRQMDNLIIPPSDASEINVLVDRVRPVMIMQDQTEYSLGVFLFADRSMAKLTGTNGYTTGSLLDQALILDQPVNRVYGFRPGTSISTAIRNLLNASPVVSYEVEDSGSKIRGSEWATWPAGTTLLQIINDLCGMGSYYSLFFDNDGVAQVIQVPDLASTEATLRYGSLEGEQRVYEGTIVETDDLLEAPNRYIVINNSLTDDPVVGFWDIPATSPNSKEQRGFVVASVHDKQGVDTNAEATAAAKAVGQADYNTYSWVSFDAAPDPRHDTFDIVSWEGINYRMQSDTLTLAPEGPHSHELRRIFGEETFGEEVVFD